MSDYRRWFVPGGMFFFTAVAYDRQPILTTQPGRQHLRTAIEAIRGQRHFELFATVLLPDHWHLIMQLPTGDTDYSTRMKRIKETFTKSWLQSGQPESEVTDSQHSRGERGIWQPRFWEHTIQSERDLECCTDYIHWNPRKHELVSQVQNWPWSSFHRFVQSGDYDKTWGGQQPPTQQKQKDWGEP
jgi:putative transposase